MRFAKRVERLGGEASKAWDLHAEAVQRKRAGEDILFLSVGDPDFETAPNIVETACASLRAGDTHYSEITGSFRLRRAIADYHLRVTGAESDPDQIVVLAGAQCAMFSVAQCLFQDGDEVIVPTPQYVTYDALLGAAGAAVVNVPLYPETGFHLDPADVEAAVSPRTRAILLTTPHNPTGAVMTRVDIEAVCAIARHHDLWLITDEVYASLTYEVPHISPSAIPGMTDRVVSIGSLSKSHAMTGWRIGWMIGPRDLAKHMAKLSLCMLYGSPTFIQNAAFEALTGEQTHQAEMKAAYQARRDLVHEILSQSPRLNCHLPQGGMFLMLDVRQTGKSAGDFAQGLLDAQGVVVLSGDAFGGSAEGHVRLSLTCDLDRLGTGVRKMRTFAESL